MKFSKFVAGIIFFSKRSYIEPLYNYRYAAGRDFEWNAELPPETFIPEIPADFTLEANSDG